MGLLKQSTVRNRMFLMVDSADHLTGKTGLAPAVTLSKNAAAFGAAAGAVTEIGSGWYNVALTAADTNTLGDLAFHATAAGADPSDWADEVSARIADDLSAPGTAQTITANQNVNVAQWNGTNVAAPATAGIPKVAIEAAGDFAQAAADKVWSTAARSLTDKIGFALSAAGVQAIWDALTANLTTVGSIGKRLADDIDATISSRSTYAGGDTAGTTTLLGRLTAGRATNLDNLDATVSSRSTLTAANVWDYLTAAVVTAGSIGKLIKDNLDATITSVKALLPAALVGGRIDASVGNMAAGVITASAHAVGAIDALALATDASTEIADNLLDRDLGAGSDTGSAIKRTVRQALRALRNKSSIAAGTLTVTKEDDATASWTAAVTTTAGNPISSIDPA
jgi:hypothetical protein